MLFYKWIFNLQIHYIWRLALTLPQLANTIHAATISTTTIDYWLFNQQTQRHSQFMLHFPLPLVHYCLTHKYNTLHNTLHSSCCNSHWNSLFALAFELLQPANTTALTTPSSFRVAFHQLSSIIHGLFYYWLFSQQTQPQLHWLHPLHFVLQFPLPLGSHFPPPLTTRYTTASTFHAAFPTAISWQLHTSLHNSPEYFPPPLTTQTTSCSIVPSPTSKHNEIHVWAFTIASTHHFASAMQSAHHPSSNQQTQPQRALTTASTAMTPPLTTCCSPT